MGSIFKPSYTRPIPADAKKCRYRAKKAVRWKGRGGKMRIAVICPKDPTRCTVQADKWWAEYKDAKGQIVREALSASRPVAERMLADILTRVEQQKAGILPDSASRPDELLSELAVQYRDHLKAKGRSPAHYETVYARVTAVLSGCRFRVFKDFDVDKVVAFLAQLREPDENGEPGIGIQTSNHYGVQVKAFAEWVSSRLDARNPLRRLKKLNPDTDVRKVRRILSAMDFARLLETTRADVKAPRSPRHRRRFTGPERWALYLVAAFTGFRASELASLTPESFDLDNRTVRVEAAYSKDRRTDTIPIPAEIAAQLFPWIASRIPGQPLWPGSWASGKHGVDMLRRDLKKAGIPYTTPDGDFDFHSLRAMYISGLADAGVPELKIQRLARHKDPRLTQRYIKIRSHNLSAEADRLKMPKPPSGDSAAG